MKFANINNNSNNNGKVSSGKASFLGVALKYGSYVAYCGGTYEPGVVTSPKADSGFAPYADDNANALAALNSLLEEQFIPSTAATAMVYTSRLAMPSKRFAVAYCAVTGRSKLYNGTPATREQFAKQIANWHNDNGDNFLSDDYSAEFLRFFDNLKLVVDAGRSFKVEDYKTLTSWRVTPIEADGTTDDGISSILDDTVATADTTAITPGEYVVEPSTQRDDFTSTLYAWDYDSACLGNAVGTVNALYWQPVGRNDYMVGTVIQSKDGERAYLLRPVYDADMNAYWARDVLNSAIKDVNYTKEAGFRTPTMPPNQRLINAIEMVALIAAECRSVADGGNDLTEAQATLRSK